MKNIPEKIYLQIGDDSDVTIGDEIPDFNELYHKAISWSSEQINSNDIEYILNKPTKSYTENQMDDAYDKGFKEFYKIRTIK